LLLVKIKSVYRGSEEMLKLDKKEFWFVVGSQHLYGKETLDEVEKQSKEIINNLSENGDLPYSVCFKQLVTTEKEITSVMKEANYRDNVAGVVTWMHTFSPAKMWIPGTKLLQKPLLHIATQYNKGIPWDKIDMEYTNLNQSAHRAGDHDFINARMTKKNESNGGHGPRTTVHRAVSEWVVAAVGHIDSQTVNVARFVDDMRHPAIIEGDKVN